MYQVTIINKGEDPIIINAISNDINAPRIKGKFKEGINTINQLDFTIYPNNPGYNKIFPLSTLIEVENTKTNEIEYRGRVLLPTPSMGSDGTLIKSVTCESELAFFMDSTTRYGEYHNVSVSNYLKIIIDNHNKQVEPEKQFTLGIVDVVDNNDSLYRYLGYEKTFKGIKDDLIDKLGGELRIRHINGIRYLDYLTTTGQKSPVDIRLSKNIQAMKNEVDPTEIITRVIPIGSKKEESEERLTIKTVNGGKDYLDNTEAIKVFGIIEGNITFDDVKDPKNLLRKGQEYISNTRIINRHDITALDLSSIGLDIESFKVGNVHRLINPLMAIDEEVRIIERTIDINEPYKSSLTIGDKFQDIKAYQNNLKKVNNKLNKDLNNRISSEVNHINLDLSNTNNAIAKQRKYIIMGV